MQTSEKNCPLKEVAICIGGVIVVMAVTAAAVAAGIVLYDRCANNTDNEARDDTTRKSSPKPFILAAHLSAGRARSLLTRGDYSEIFNQAGYRWSGTSEAWGNIAGKMALEKIETCPDSDAETVLIVCDVQAETLPQTAYEMTKFLRHNRPHHTALYRCTTPDPTIFGFKG